MAELPTVMIRKANKWGYAIINAADFDATRHEMFDAPAARDEDEAPAAIPADWEGMHWKKRVSLAKHLTGQEAANADQADELIRAHIAAATVEA